MVNIDDYYQVFKKIFTWLNKLPSFYLSICIIILLAIIVVIIKYYKGQKALIEARNEQISNEVFSIKNQNTNTSVIAIFPEKVNCTHSNFSNEYNCKLLLNSFECLGDNFAITISTKDNFIVTDATSNVISPTFIGGYYKLHMNEHYFQTVDKYCFVTFILNIESISSVSPSIQIDLTNEHANGTFKFILPV